MAKRGMRISANIYINDGKLCPLQPRGALTMTQQQPLCAYQRGTKLPLDDVFITLKDKIPALKRSNFNVLLCTDV